MKVHHRVVVVQFAELAFLKSYREILSNHGNVTLNDEIRCLSTIMSRIDVDDLTPLNEFQMDVQTSLFKVLNKHNITYGEIIKILSSKLADISKYAIRWERHKDFGKEGDVDYSEER